MELKVVFNTLYLPEHIAAKYNHTMCPFPGLVLYAPECGQWNGTFNSFLYCGILGLASAFILILGISVLCQYLVIHCSQWFQNWN